MKKLSAFKSEVQRRHDRAFDNAAALADDIRVTLPDYSLIEVKTFGTQVTVKKGDDVLSLMALASPEDHWVLEGHVVDEDETLRAVSEFLTGLGKYVA